MKLKEFVLAFGDMYENDITLIKDFLTQNNLETEAIGMISKLAYEKSYKDSHSLEVMKGNVTMLSMNNYRDYYPKEFADLLQKASLAMAIGEDITTYKGLWEELKASVPQHSLKYGLMWKDLHELLTKNNIYFKGENSNGTK